MSWSKPVSKMLRILAFLGLVATVWGARLDAYTQGGRIVNGTDAKEGQYPYIISLRYLGSHSCGGSIINNNWILTAAHCVNGDRPSYLSIQAGTTEITQSKGVIVNVSEIIAHSGYNPSNTYINDIAVLKLAEPLEYTTLIQPVKLPKQAQDTPGGSPATLIGWGYPYSGGNVMKKLQTVDIGIVSDKDCQAVHGAAGMAPHDSNICAGIPEGGKGQCSGDSGGPLSVNGTQVGIVSWSRKPCTIAPYPGVFTEVSWYIDWINEQISK